MRILLRLPTWLGDAVMATPTIELLKSHYPQASFTLVGSDASIGLFEYKDHPYRLFVDKSKQAKNRFFATYRLAKKVGQHDIAITFQNNFYSALLLFFTKTPCRIGYAKELRSLLLTHAFPQLSSIHQVERYLHLLLALHISIPKHPKLHLVCTPDTRGKKIRIGINAGAAYGSAKRWCEAYFIEVMLTLLEKDYEVILYGGKSETMANNRIVSALKSLSSIKNLVDLTAKTNIQELISSIASLDLFLTNDSGPMHIASSLNIPIIALFGPTDSQETSPYNTQAARILINKNLPCAPCKKRECPLKHHQCMKSITPDEVLHQIDKIILNLGR